MREPRTHNGLSLISGPAHRTPFAVSDVRPRSVFGVDDLIAPTALSVCAFAGEVKPEQHTADSIATEMNVYPGLKWDGTDGPYHSFQLPVPHPGHSAFRGCSGAPVVDMERRVVGFVCDGDMPSNTVRAVAATTVAAALRAYCKSHGAA